jgi:23S rRNA pseudouridine1911/1915/1917 synthase
MPNFTENNFANPPNPPLPSGPEALLGRRPKGGKGGFSFSLQVTVKDQGRRIDRFLSESGLNLSRSQAKHLIEQKMILLNRQPVKPSTHLKTGNVISGTLTQPSPLALKPEPIPLFVLFEDSSMIVVDKPSGMVVHPAPGNLSGTLVNALLHHCRDLSGINGVMRPGIVHRLDKETSGVMVIAKDDQSYDQLARQFKNRTVEKVYLTLAYGNLKQDEGLIDAPIGRHPDQRKKMSTRARKGKTALTRWKVLERFGPFTFLEIYPRTGRTHQIRVHLSSMGHPLLGDPLYGRKGKPGTKEDTVLRECVKRMNRQALHAHKLGLNHPRTGERVQFVAPIPQDMMETLECLRSMA